MPFAYTRVTTGTANVLEVNSLFDVFWAAGFVLKLFAVWSSNASPMMSLRSRSKTTCSKTLYSIDLMPLYALWWYVSNKSSSDSSTTVYNSFVIKFFSAYITSLAITSFLSVRRLSWLFSCYKCSPSLAAVATLPVHGELSSFNVTSSAYIKASSLTSVLSVLNYWLWEVGIVASGLAIGRTMLGCVGIHLFI